METTQIPEWMDQVGAGWHPILGRLHAALVALAPGYTVGQVKEKYGELRVYLDWLGEDWTATDAAAVALCETAERESLRTCEACGLDTRVRPVGDPCRCGGSFEPDEAIEVVVYAFDQGRTRDVRDDGGAAAALVA